jgi:hypothetical protein
VVKTWHSYWWTGWLAGIALSFAALFGAPSPPTAPPPPPPEEVVGNPDKRPDQSNISGWIVPEKSGAEPPSEPIENSWIRSLIAPASRFTSRAAMTDLPVTSIRTTLIAAEEGVMSVVLIATLIKAMLDVGNLIKLATEFRDKFKRPPSRSEVASIVHQSEEQAAQTVAKGGFDSFALPTQSIIVDLTGKMTSIGQKIREALDEPDMNLDDMNKRIGHFQREYCNYMFLMQKFNRDELPEVIKHEWDANSCSKYSFL